MIDLRPLLLAALLVFAPPAAADDEVAPAHPKARAELLAEFVPPRRAEMGDDARAVQDAREAAALATLRPIERRLALSVDGKPVSGIGVRAWHDVFDLVTETVPTDATGVAALRLPPGEWRVLISGKISRDRVAFGEVRVDESSTADVPISLDTETVLKFKRRGGAPVTPDKVVLATEDHRHRFDIAPPGSRLVVRRPTGGRPTARSSCRRASLRDRSRASSFVRRSRAPLPPSRRAATARPN